ncbi:MAG: hypothetical protein GC185_02745 [Alphaproteobacteria bacterium]|nr:hypothetical protein [Alphaproteobacteria bacterium]
MRHALTCLALAGGLAISAAFGGAAFAQDAMQDSAAQPAQQEPEPPKPAWMEYQNPYAATENDLSNPHRTSDEIVTWAQNEITASMSFKSAEFNEKVTSLRTLFTDQGWRDYVTYLKSSQLVDMVRNQHFNVTTIINGDSTIINSGPVAGTYHWLVEAPTITSFTSKDADGRPVTVAGGNFKIDMQIGRVPTGGVDGMAIESWHVEKQLPTQQ